MTAGEPTRADWPWRWVLVFVLGFAAMGAVRASLSRSVGGDFLRYHRAGRMVVTGQSDRLYDPEFLAQQRVYAEERATTAAEGRRDDLRETEFKYAPAFAVLMAPIGALHPRTGWIVWGAWNGMLIALTFVAAWGLGARGAAWKWMAVPAVVMANAVNDNMNLGQLNPSMVAPAALALLLLERGRPVVAGLTAAFGTVVKFLPGLLLIWFALRRRWMAVASLVAGVAVLGVGLPAAVLGWSRSIDIAQAWRDARLHKYTDLPADDLPGHSIKSFVHRVFGGTHYKTGTGANRIDWDVSLAHADPGVLRWVVVALVVALLVFVVVAALRTFRDDRNRAELPAALFVCWMVLASPEARSPQFLYLVVPVTVLTYSLVRAHREQAPGRHLATAFAVLAAVLLNTGSETLLGRTLSNEFAAYCAHGWATLLLMASLWMVMRQEEARGSRDEG